MKITFKDIALQNCMKQERPKTENINSYARIGD